MDTIARKCHELFKPMNNRQLVESANRKPYSFGQEIVELERRERESGGKFVYDLVGDELVIVKDETTTFD